MFCPNCGKEIPNDSDFCPLCGGKIEGGNSSSVNFSNGLNPAELFDFNRTGVSYNYVGFGAAVLMLLCTFLPIYKASAWGISKSSNLFGVSKFGTTSGIVFLLCAIAIGVFSFLKKDTYVLIAGLVALFFCILLIFHFFTGGTAKATRMAKELGVSAGPTFTYILLWIASLGGVAAGVIRKFVPALR